MLLIIEIEVVSETTEEELQAAEGDKPQLTEGVTVAYTKPAKPSQVFTDSVGGGGEGINHSLLQVLL